jgi:hypothetical protein
MDEEYNREDFTIRNSNDSLIQAWKKVEKLYGAAAANSSKQMPINNHKKSTFGLSLLSLSGSGVDKENKEIRSSQTSASSSKTSSIEENNEKKTTSLDELPNVVKLVNKSPEWHKELNSFALNFNGRVTMSSVKNFQIVHDLSTNYIVMQFGKVANNLYTCDYSYPFSALQAFAVALSSLDDKIGCD